MTEAHKFLNKVAGAFGWGDITQLAAGDELLAELEKMLND